MKVNKPKKGLNAIAYNVQLLLLVSIIIISACSQNQRSKVISKATDTIIAPLVTILSQLPHHHKPKVILLENAPKPVTINVLPRYINSITEEIPVDKKIAQPLTQRTSPFIKNLTNVPPAAEAQGKGFFTTYTTDDGLALDQIYCSYKDKRGNLWFGTNGGGVCEYDGKSFTNYTTAQGLASNVIWCITEDHAGNLWFGTDGSGASKYDGERFTNYTTAQGLPDNVVFTIIEDKTGNLWFGTLKGGVSKYDPSASLKPGGERFTNYTTAQGLAHNAVKCIIEDSKGKLWFGTLGGGVSKYDPSPSLSTGGKNFTNYTTSDGLANNVVWSIAEDSSGNLWFGTDSGVVSKYDPSASLRTGGSNFSNYPTSQETAGNVILSIIKDKQNNLWFGTLKSGVSKYDGTGFTNYTTSEGLANNSVRSIIEDEKGNLWFSTYGGGISKYAGNSFTNFTTAQGLSNNVVFSIVEDNPGNLWLGTSGGGISKYDPSASLRASGKSFTNYTTLQGLASNVIYCIEKDKEGNLWVGTSGGGVSKYDGKSFTNYTTLQGLANNVIFCIKEDKKGNLWFGTSGGGVSKYDGKSFTNYTTVQGLANNVVFSITEDNKGKLWFGTLGGGVSKYDPSASLRTGGESFTNYTTAQGLANNVVWCITQDKTGNLWFGTQQGLSLMPKQTVDQLPGNNRNMKTFAGHLFESFTTKDGLPDNFITQVVQGDDEKLYIGTNIGIAEMMPINIEGEIQKNWTISKKFNSQTGYPIKDVNAGPGAMYKDRNGVIWIGTGSDKTGLVRFEPKAVINNNLIPPKVFIKNIKINNETICWNDLYTKRYNEKTDSNSTAPIITDEVNTFGRQLSDFERDSIRTKYKNISFDGVTKWYQIPQKLILPYYYNNIGFDFNAVETGKNFLVKYQYMLEGYDKDWSPAGSKTSVNFGNIYEGTYTFMLRAQSPEGVWSNPITYTFKVLPPWWRTWWMYVVYAIVAIGLILLLFWWNHRRIIYQKNILEHKVRVATKQISEENEKVKAQKKKTEETLKELEAAQAQLIQSEKMASLGQLTAGIAHEIQNPLNFVNNFSEVNTELIQELKSEKSKVKSERDEELETNLLNDLEQNLEKISHHSKRADGIVKAMLQHSQTSTGQKELTDINALANECLKISYQGFRAKDNSFNAVITKNFDPDIKAINVIPQDIVRALINLCNNAFYAVNEKRKMNIDGYEPAVSITTKKFNDKAEVRVKDNGNGIPQKVLNKIFQPFFTTKPTGQGTGLGLSLSYDIIKAHGGEIKVETKEGEGAEFIIRLPG